MSIAITSRMALKDLQERLPALQRAVWEAIRDWPREVGPSIQELAVQLRRKECCICGRIDDLRKAGAIADGQIKPGGCGKPVKTYRALVWREPIGPGQLELL